MEMKRVLSISLGAKSRDHTVTAEFAGVPFELSRVGCDGDLRAAVQMFRRYDGTVDAFGLGGAVLFLELGKRRYYFRDCKRIRRAVKRTKLADGNGIKHILESRAVDLLAARIGGLRGKRAFVISGADRYGQAKALFDAGCRTVAGDLIFTMGLDVPLRSLLMVEALGALILPPALLAPFSLYYPTGEQQERPPVYHRRFSRYYEEADIIAGDYLWLRKYMPGDMSGKIVLTNTTTKSDVEELQKRGVKLLITSTPRLHGRSFGTNVLEAMTLCLIDKPQAEITRADYVAAVDQARLAPQVEALN
jgi:hypothetical protein